MLKEQADELLHEAEKLHSALEQGRGNSRYLQFGCGRAQRECRRDTLHQYMYAIELYDALRQFGEDGEKLPEGVCATNQELVKQCAVGRGSSALCKEPLSRFARHDA